MVLIPTFHKVETRNVKMYTATPKYHVDKKRKTKNFGL